MPPLDDLARTLSQASRRDLFESLIAAAVIPAGESAAKKKGKKKKKKAGSGKAPVDPTTTTTTTSAPDIYACPPNSCGRDGPVNCGPPGSLCRCIGWGSGPGACVVMTIEPPPHCDPGGTCPHIGYRCLNTCASGLDYRCLRLCRP